ncbi:MerR family transcriptional regulator [Geopsychrobacter electrodiphilus]|uniref:helix-turn-helix domain-containing protein n=1 Tax=Geopsychrobacter electrodiphilus TaxID=225196 RepID=UPI00036A84DB|nr:MerR family transcriptional regulator [Geopsychrobacter electrodiphilus]
MTALPEHPIAIGEVARRLGITTRTIRYYEEIGLMGPPERVGGGTRMYDRAEILRLKFILKLKELGISLKEMQIIAEYFDVNDQNFGTLTPHLVELLDGHIGKVDEKIANLASLRREIVDYRSRIVDILQGKVPPVR